MSTPLMNDNFGRFPLAPLSLSFSLSLSLSLSPSSFPYIYSTVVRCDSSCYEKKRERKTEHVPRERRNLILVHARVAEKAGHGIPEPHCNSAFRMRRHGLSVRSMAFAYVIGGCEYARSHRDYCIISIDKRKRQLALGGREREGTGVAELFNGRHAPRPGAAK